MTTAITIPHIEPGADRAHLRATLVKLVDMGLQIAQHIHHQVVTTPVPPPAPEPEPRPEQRPSPKLESLAAAFERLSRGIRRTVLLIEHLDAPRPAPPPEPPAPSAEDARAKSLAARKRILREVDDAIVRTYPDPDDAEPLHAECRERLEQPDFELELANNTLESVIKDVLHDMGLTARHEARHVPFPYARRTPADHAILVCDATPPVKPDD